MLAHGQGVVVAGGQNTGVSMPIICINQANAHLGFTADPLELAIRAIDAPIAALWDSANFSVGGSINKLRSYACSRSAVCLRGVGEL